MTRETHEAERSGRCVVLSAQGAARDLKTGRRRTRAAAQAVDGFTSPRPATRENACAQQWRFVWCGTLGRQGRLPALALFRDRRPIRSREPSLLLCRSGAARLNAAVEAQLAVCAQRLHRLERILPSSLGGRQARYAPTTDQTALLP